MAVRLWEIFTNLAYLITHVAASEWVCAICHCPYLLKHVLRYCDKVAKILLSIKTRDPQNAMARLSVHYHKTRLNLKILCKVKAADADKSQKRQKQNFLDKVKSRCLQAFS